MKGYGELIFSLSIVLILFVLGIFVLTHPHVDTRNLPRDSVVDTRPTGALE